MFDQVKAGGISGVRGVYDAGMVEGSVSVVSPGAYAVSDGGGCFTAHEEHGLFWKDMRHLSKFVLRVDGERPVPIRSAVPEVPEVRGSEAEFSFEFSGASICRSRRLGEGFEEKIEVFGGGTEEIHVEFECEADFLDIYEVRDYAKAGERGEVSQTAVDGGLRFSYRRGEFQRGTVVRVDGGGGGGGGGAEPVVEGGRISLKIVPKAGEARTINVSVALEEDGEEVAWKESGPLYGCAPEFRAENGEFERTWRRSVGDLETLAFDVGDGLLVPAAGSPWYMALFGRDSLITSYMTMTLGAESAKNTLRALARRQAANFDDFTDAEPGKILHEMRRGELAFFGESPETPYYGTADATPLFLILLEEVWKWTGDGEFIREMEGAARAALGWILTHSDKVGDGFVAYETRSTAGLENQGWKDSEDSMLFRDGTMAEGPIAPCEVQGYVYDALLRTATLSEKVWRDTALAVELREEAVDLKNRFDRNFWMEDRKYYALALDGDGRKVDSIASNAGHLLWSGIVPNEKARLVADTLLGEDLFSGWGIRTMAEGEGGYDPLSYHNGSIWPHDNAIIAEGLRRYGLREEANRVAEAIFEAAPCFEHRLPEVFAGHRREKGHPPVELPKSCSPQAWAAASVVSLVRTMLGVEPDFEERGISAAPGVSGVRLLGISAFGGFHDVRSGE